MMRLLDRPGSPLALRVAVVLELLKGATERSQQSRIHKAACPEARSRGDGLDG